METHIDSLITEIEEDFKSYKDAGLIDRASLYRWGLLALRSFGQSILTKVEHFVEVKDGVGILPDNFQSLHYAIGCSPSHYECEEGCEGTLQSSMFWNERTERKIEWNSCDPCCSEESETLIEEKVYLNECEVSFYYNNPTPLRLVNHTRKAVCSSNCENLRVKSEYEISINNNRVFTNFTEGTIFIIYYGIETDDDGLYYIPHTPRGALLTYIEAHLKKRILENIAINGDGNVGNLLQYQANEEMNAKSVALSDARYMTLTPNSYAKIARLNKRNIRKYEILLPSKY